MLTDNPSNCCSLLSQALGVMLSRSAVAEILGESRASAKRAHHETEQHIAFSYISKSPGLRLKNVTILSTIISCPDKLITFERDLPYQNGEEMHYYRYSIPQMRSNTKRRATELYRYPCAVAVSPSYASNNNESLLPQLNLRHETIAARRSSQTSLVARQSVAVFFKSAKTPAMP